MNSSKKPLVLWITGLAGAGKTTLAKGVFEKLKRITPNVVTIDGDEVREIFGQDLGYSKEDRVKNAHRISKLCRYLSDQGLIVVCSTMSLYPEIWAWNRANIQNYVQVYVKVNIETLRARNKKNLYAEPDSQVVGVDQQFDEPLNSELILSNESESDLSGNVERIVDFVKGKI